MQPDRAQTDAIARLQASLGADPLPHPFERVQAAVERKAAAVAAALPPGLGLQDGQLAGMPALLPRTRPVLNPETVAAARRLTPVTLDRLHWRCRATMSCPC